MAIIQPATMFVFPSWIHHLLNNQKSKIILNQHISHYIRIEIEKTKTFQTIAFRYARGQVPKNN